MDRDAPDPGLVRAQWVLGRLDPEDLPPLAGRFLQEGFDGQSLRELAGLTKPTRADIEQLVDAALGETGAESMDGLSAAWTVARSIAAKIIRGDLAPHDGARDIGNVARMNAELAPLMVFAGLASEWEDDLLHRSQYEGAILEEARSIVEEA